LSKITSLFIEINIVFGMPIDSKTEIKLVLWEQWRG